METIRPAKVGSGARWEPLLSQDNKIFYGNLVLATGTEYVIGLFLTSNAMICIGIWGKGFAAYDHEVKPETLSMDLKINLSDASNLADFLNVQLGVEYQELGQYQPNFCRP